jgi:tRNA A-37 threonylcarbamoyl transferase component Bud32
MKKVIASQYKTEQSELDNFILNFDTQGVQFGKIKKNTRNLIKLFDLHGKTINIKSFKIPNIVNQIVYSFFRKSKAQRSFEYAKKLSELGIGTPEPIAYYEFTSFIMFKRSFYISEHLECDLTYRELTTNFNYPDHENILRAFTKFTFDLHEKGINFLDHSPGNTLIKKTDKGYEFFLVDLNRMEFKFMDFESRIKNMSRLTTQDDLIKIMSDEYAKLYNTSYNKVYNKLWEDINTFQDKIIRKKKLKKKLLFRK